MATAGGRREILVKYSKALSNFICDKVEEGITVAEICRTYEDMPIEKTIYRWKKQYPEFKAQINEAYQTFFYKKIDELEELSKAEVPMTFTDDEGQVQKHSKEYINAELNRRRMRIDTLKFMLAKLAPNLVPELQDQSAKASASVTINVVKYDSNVSS